MTVSAAAVWAAMDAVIDPELDRSLVELGVDHGVHRCPDRGGADRHAVTSLASAPSASGPGPVDAFWPNWSARSFAPCSTGSMP